MPLRTLLQGTNSGGDKSDDNTYADVCDELLASGALSPVDDDILLEDPLERGRSRDELVEFIEAEIYNNNQQNNNDTTLGTRITRIKEAQRHALATIETALPKEHTYRRRNGPCVATRTRRSNNIIKDDSTTRGPIHLSNAGRPRKRIRILTRAAKQ